MKSFSLVDYSKLASACWDLIRHGEFDKFLSTMRELAVLLKDHRFCAVVIIKDDKVVDIQHLRYEKYLDQNLTIHANAHIKYPGSKVCLYDFEDKNAKKTTT